MAPAAELVIATVNNGHMITLQGLSHEFEEANPGVKLRWVTLDEESLRQQVSTDIATRVEVVKRRDAFERSPDAFIAQWRAEDERIRRRIVAARKRRDGGLDVGHRRDA